VAIKHVAKVKIKEWGYVSIFCLAQIPHMNVTNPEGTQIHSTDPLYRLTVQIQLYFAGIWLNGESRHVWPAEAPGAGARRAVLSVLSLSISLSSTNNMLNAFQGHFFLRVRPFSNTR
jgi:hypothetical protein